MWKDGPASWFLLHLSVGCHIFYSILLIIIVKCLFILAAASLLAYPCHLSPWWRRRRNDRGKILWESKQDFWCCCVLVDAIEGIFLVRKNSPEMFAIKLRDSFFFLSFSFLFFHGENVYAYWGVREFLWTFVSDWSAWGSN